MPARTEEWLKLRVASVHRETDEIKSFVLTDPAGFELPPFSAGSHLEVRCGEGGPLRHYSLHNDPADRTRYEIAVKRELDSRGGSAFMHDGVAQGDSLFVSKPRNNFPLQEDAAFSLLLAGGIGITPLLSMAQRLDALGRPFSLLYCARSRSHAAFLPRLAKRLGGERFGTCLSEDPASVSAEIEQRVASVPAGGMAYVCGPAGFMQTAKGLATERLGEGRVRLEYFSAEPSTPKGPQFGFSLVLARSGLRLQVAPDQSVLEVLEAAGLDVPSSCEQGVCGTCLTRILEGEVDHRDLYLTEEEQAANQEMCVCVSRALSDCLVLDL